MTQSQDWFRSASDWSSYATKNEIQIPNETDACALDDIRPVELNPIKSRAAQLLSLQAWSREHPLSSVGYQSREFTVPARDGNEIAVKASWPMSTRRPIADTPSEHGHLKAQYPVLFVMHGGGWIQGNHTSEEQWLLWPVYEAYDVAIISVEYRLAPEHTFQVSIDDAWDVLNQLLASPAEFIPGSDIVLDLESIILAGSSSGACITALLSQKCRDVGIPIHGVILNVPVLCDYRHLPLHEFLLINDGGRLSYEQCTTAYLSSGVMKAVWDLVIPSPSDGSNPLVSPLLGRVHDLPPHLMFVAGQDPLRDEGICYAQKLQVSGVSVRSVVYPGVPHTYAEIHDLESTKKFWDDLRQGMNVLFGLRRRQDVSDMTSSRTKEVSS